MRCSIQLTDIKCYQSKLYKKQIQERESEGKNAKINDNYNAEVVRVNRVLRIVAMRQIKNRLLERQKPLLAFLLLCLFRHIGYLAKNGHCYQGQLEQMKQIS